MKKHLLILLCVPAFASAELVQQFKDPTFSGQGWASQVLTIEQMRQSAKNSIESKAASDKAAAEAASANTPLAKFMSLFTGQVYSQLATQLTNNLFKECAGANSTTCVSGQFNVSETQQISWKKSDDGKSVQLSVYNGTAGTNGAFTRAKDSNGSESAAIQTIWVPISSFSF